MSCLVFGTLCGSLFLSKPPFLGGFSSFVCLQFPCSLCRSELGLAYFLLGLQFCLSLCFYLVCCLLLGSGLCRLLLCKFLGGLFRSKFGFPFLLFLERLNRSLHGGLDSSLDSFRFLSLGSRSSSFSSFFRLNASSFGGGFSYCSVFRLNSRKLSLGFLGCDP